MLRCLVNIYLRIQSHLNASNLMMKYYYTKWYLLHYPKIYLIAFCLLFNTRGYAQVGEVLWEENFNTLDSDTWNVDVGDGCAQNLCGWGNQELQWYAEDNVSIEPVPGESGNNALVLEARKQALNGKGFTSGKIQSNAKLAVQYGLIEVRMRVPDLRTGLWPAAWLLGTTSIAWPGKGEIDIMEMGHAQAERARQGYPEVGMNSYVGSNLIFAADAACSDGNPSCAASTAFDVDYNTPYVASEPLNDRFVVYRLYWTSESIRFTITDQGTEYDLYASPFVIGEESTEFQQPFYLLFNMAVGGTFTDAATDGQVTASLPAKMYVDYVRVSKYNGEGEVFYENINPPETGTLGVFTDETPTTNNLQAGASSEIFVWNNLVEGTTAPFEGSEVIAWALDEPNEWFGGGIISRQARDMSNFADGNLRFTIKIPADVSFRIGITDNFTNQSFIEFPANQTKYGLVRNGEWGEVTIPISELKGELIALQSMQYLFAITSVDGAFPTSNFQLGIDDIYWEGGGDDSGPDPDLEPSFSQRIEAEDFAVAAGVQTENCTEGGLNVGYIDAGDWMVWDVNLPAEGDYLVEYRVASPNDNGMLQLEQAGGSPTFGNPVSIPTTGGWQNWTTVSQVVTLPAGQQQLAVSVPAGGWNINWLNVSSAQGASAAEGAAVGANGREASNLTKKEAVIIYPNPVAAELTIAGLDSEAAVILYDVAGQVMRRYEASENAQPLDVRDLLPGIYFLRVQGDAVRTLKFVKK